MNKKINMNNSIHPIISMYCKTSEHCHPIILHIGREPNTQQTIGDHVGNYDFDLNPETRHCGFWNSSYSLFAYCVGLNSIKELKNYCKKAGTSPLVYADALPIGIPNRQNTKKKSRWEVAPNDCTEHIKKLFNHRAVWDRVKLVLLSGIDEDVFKLSVEALEEGCKKRNINFAHVSFFNYVNQPKLKHQITKYKHIYNTVWDKFKSDTGI